jgi:hypothetical protein
MSGSNDDAPEVTMLEKASEWRLRLVDADPGDERSARAARQLEKLANELRMLHGSPSWTEYMAIHNFLGEFDGLAEFSLRVQDFNDAIGFGRWAEDGEGYLRALIEMAKETLGTG